MKYFEYMTLDSPSVHELNTVGSEGWEMCGVKYDPDDCYTEVFLKREISRSEAQFRRMK